VQYHAVFSFGISLQQGSERDLNARDKSLVRELGGRIAAARGTIVAIDTSRRIGYYRWR
jgi:hypothetical protein